MGKKNKKNKQNFNSNASGLVFGLETDDEGFGVLQRKNHGPVSGSTLQRRSSKICSYEATEQKTKVKVFDTKPMSELLDSLEELMKAGKYGEGLTTKNDQIIQEFIDAAMNCEADTELGKKLMGMTRKLLSICKSYYEYDELNRELIDNITYDGLMARYLKTGAVEPVGIIPKGLKNLKKVDIKYPTLHNNMDKAYAIMDADPIPVGVKETDKIEDFLVRVYKAIGASSESDISLEISPKIDGVSMNATLKEDILLDPQTRGDEDSSVAVIGANGMIVSAGFTAEHPFGIQYEAFCTEEDRVKASEYLGLDRPYVSCRHAAAGIIHRLCTMEDDKLLQFISLYPIASEGLEGTYLERMDYISNFGIVPKDMPKREVIHGNMDTLLKTIRGKFEQLAELRENLSFAIDGMVITIADDDNQKALGRDGRTNKFQIALKFDPATAVAHVNGITLDSGKKGFRTIQVELDHPVFLDGVRYDHVPVATAAMYEDLHLRHGSLVRIHRVGDVIPSITVEDEGTGYKLNLPTTCPDCGKKLTIRNKKLFCENSSCKGNIVGKFTNFFDKMGMVGYSDSFSELLHTKMGCNDLADVLKLTDQDFEDKGCAGAQSAGFVQRLMDAIGEKPDYEVLGAMGLPGVGPQKAKILLKELDLARDFGNESNLSFTYSLRRNNACVAAVGPKQSGTLNVALTSPVFNREWKAIMPLLKKITTDFSKKLRVGHTGGALSNDVLAVCEKLGFDVVDGKSFDILITSSMGRSSGKMDVAKVKNLPIFTEDLFLEQYGDERAC